MFKYLFNLQLFQVTSILIAFFASSSLSARTLDEIKKSNILNILTRNAPTTYFIDRDGNPAGMDHDLGKSLADQLGVVPKFIIKDSINDILISLKGGEGDIALAGLTRTEQREKDFIFSSNYQSIKQQLVCHKKFIIKNMSSLAKVNILIAKGTSYEQTLLNFKKDYKDIKFQTTDKMNTEEILGEVWSGKVDCTLADSNIVSVVLRTYPELKIQKSYGYQGLKMMFPQGSEELSKVANRLIKKLQDTRVLSKIEDRYYGHIKEFDYYDLKVFKKRIKKRLSKYKTLFKKAGKKYDIDWRLIAAISYQESHWNPKAKSPTGVRGMMMLTRATAKEVKVHNRLNPAESIFGGTKYLKLLLNRVPKYIKKHDRLWMAVASYNVGYYHLRDARSIAIWMEKNPNFWKDVKDSLPHLSNKKYYRKLPYGYARGLEPVLYVKRIRHYYDILRKEYPQKS